jgi:hypothetical protein
MIPNVQLFIIPHPSDDPASWQLKMFITPSRHILYTAVTLIVGSLASIVAVRLE